MKKYSIRMLGFDLDGTILTSDKVLTERTKEALQRAEAQGVKIVPATGRPLSGVPEEILGFPGVRYALTANGARIVDLETGKMVYEQLVSYDTARAVLEICGKYDAILEVYYDGTGYADEEKLRRLREFVPAAPMADYVRSTRIPVDSVRELFEEKRRGTDKVQAIFSDGGDRKRAWEELQERVPDIEITGSMSNNIEVNAKGVNKGRGLLMLGRTLGIQREEIMACGDGFNDIEMLRAAGLGVAMYNAAEQVKQAADVVTLSNDEDGVAAAIETYIL